MPSITDYYSKVLAGTTRPVATTLSSQKLVGAVSVSLQATTGWETTTPVHGIMYRVDASNNKVPGSQIDWKAIVSGTTLTNFTVTAGTDDTYEVGSVVELSPTAAWGDDMASGILQFANPDGTLIQQAVKDALGITGDPSGGWSVLNSGTAPTVSSGYNKGQKEFDLTFAGVDLTSVLTPGMRLKLDRSITPPTQCTDLESSTSQYWSKSSPTGIAFTDDFTCEAWIKLESYTGNNQGIVARRNGSTEGFSFSITASGQVELLGLRIASNNRSITSYQSVPMGMWVHVAASLDMSGNTGSVWINGALVPTFMTTNGTATALVQGTTALVVGSRTSAGAEYFDGEVADVRIWSALRTSTQIRDNMNQLPIGNESNLVFAVPFNGNSNDLTTNANNLSAQAGSGYVTDSPYKSTEYAIITKVAFSTNTTVTVFTGTDYNIPNMTLTNPYYSSHRAPYGFPSSKTKWLVAVIDRTLNNRSSPTQNVWYNENSIQIILPTGEWGISFGAVAAAYRTSNGQANARVTLSSANNTQEDIRYTVGAGGRGTTDGTQFGLAIFVTKEFPYTTSTQVTLYRNYSVTDANITNFYNDHSSSEGYITAECAYL